MSRTRDRIVFLEEWLKTKSYRNGDLNAEPPTSLEIVHSWAALRDSLQRQTLSSHHLNSLKTLIRSKIALHVAEPQARLLLSIISSKQLSLPQESYPMLFKILYIWIRKATRPPSSLLDSTADVVLKVISDQSSVEEDPLLLATCILTLGALACAKSISENFKEKCLQSLHRLLENGTKLFASFESLHCDILAGAGYALSSSPNQYFIRIFDTVLSIWTKPDGWCLSVFNGLILLHLTECVISDLIGSSSEEKLLNFTTDIVEDTRDTYAPCVLIMIAAGSLRAMNSLPPQRIKGVTTLSRLKSSSQHCIENMTEELIPSPSASCNSFSNNLMLQCVSLALVRCGPMPHSFHLCMSLALALLYVVFPLQAAYSKILDTQNHRDNGFLAAQASEHVTSVCFKEAGAITRVFCDHYIASEEEEKKIKLQNMVFKFCNEIYTGHRKVTFVLGREDDSLIKNIEVIAESALVMVVMFYSVVIRHNPGTEFLNGRQEKCVVNTLISLSCLEYFRRTNIPEYLDTIRGAVTSLLGNENACVSFVNSMPPYDELVNLRELRQDVEYLWFNDNVQSSRILFYMRVISLYVEKVPDLVFRETVAPVMFLYMGHPETRITQASHSLFRAFVASHPNTSNGERESSKEQLAFSYVEKSLEGYPGVTPFNGMASGFMATLENLPAGSPAAFYCIHRLVDKADTLACVLRDTEASRSQKVLQCDQDAFQKITGLLMRLIFVVDIQVIPSLLQLLAGLVRKLQSDNQIMILNELHLLVAKSDDVTRKPTLVSWLHSLSYLCSESPSKSACVKSLQYTSSFFSRILPRL